ncbi:hypothetical protein J437_LFUL004377 [Ladona fulva]|uniref:DUF3668 domain-containing protein n=1 Tax=Ladona fulva TaxID=123851 RepID=A0A8K0K1T1_LADFU|nr:hypothetical protein J437_LFUL004377 [Ladona fulva]
MTSFESSLRHYREIAMDEMKSVVLEVKEGRGFENFTDDIIIQANLDGVTSKTLPTRATRDGNVYFNNELVWEVHKKYLRRMKISSAALKVECFSVKNLDKRFRIGYISLKLKSIKEARNGEEIEGEWIKLLGVALGHKQSIPSVFLKFYLQESLSSKEDEGKITSPPLTELIPTLTKEKGLIQIGPVDGQTECFILGFKLIKMNNLSMLCPEDLVSDGGFSFLYTLFGFDVKTETFKDLSMYSLQEKIVIKLRTSISFLRSYLGSNPSLCIRLMSKDMVLGYSKADLRILLPETGISGLPRSIENNLKLFSPANSKNKDEPFISLLMSLEVFDEDEISSAAAASLMSQKGDLNLESVMSSKKDVEVKGISKEETSPPTTVKVDGKDEFLPLQPGNNKKSHVKNRKASNKPYVNDATIYKVVEELEDWKEMQKELFIDKMKHKEKKHLELLSEEWSIKRERLESNLSKVINQNEILMNSLKEALTDLQERKNKVEEKDKLLKFLKDDLERSYNQKLHDLQVTSKRMEDDYKHKVELLERQNREQELKCLDVERENIILKDKVKELDEEINRIMKTSLTKDQTASLLTEVKSLQENLDISDKSKAFFKQQWAKAVREIHQLKTENQESLQLWIKHNKEELKQLGLSGSPSGQISQGMEETNVLNHSERRSVTYDSGDRLSSCSRMSLPRQYQPTPTVNVNEEKLQHLIEERNSLLRTVASNPAI